MASKKSAPPRFRNDFLYKVWKSKLSMWTLVTAVPKREQAIVVLLESLDGNHKAEKAVADSTADELNKDDGLKILLEILDVSFQADKIDDAYRTYVDFNSNMKSPHISMSDYIIEFEHRYFQHDMKLPDIVLAFKLLDGARLTDDQRQLVLSLGNDLKFSSMKSALKRIFSKVEDNLTQEMGKLDAKKEEEAYVSSDSDKKYSYNRKTYDGNRFRTDKRTEADYVPFFKKKENSVL